MAARKLFSEGEDGIFIRQAGFVIETWRQAALGQANVPKLLREFRRHCGDAAEDVFEQFFSFLHLLGRDSRRRLAVGHPGCPGMTRDEIQVLALLAAAQDEHRILFEAHLCWLAPDGPRAKISAAATNLAEGLARCGVDISDRVARTAMPREAFRGLVIVRKAH